MSWRVTYSEVSRSDIGMIKGEEGMLSDGGVLRAPGRLELRDENDGTVMRLAKDAEFEVKDTPLGKKPVYYGEVFTSFCGRDGKYRTSCYMQATKPVRDVQVFIRPGAATNVDEFLAVSGDILIYEFDERGRTFNICHIEEGEKAVITYNPDAANMRDRYKAEITAYTDSEYEYVLNEYVDRRKWI